MCGPSGTACGDATAPLCDGTCPEFQYCSTNDDTTCHCLDLGCGQQQGPPACVGRCPDDKACADVGGTCTCVP
jgi:hypothetical protein